MACVLGVIAEKNRIAYTRVTAEGAGSGLIVDEEVELSTPASHESRGAQLDWLFKEAQEFITRLKPDVVAMQKPGQGAGRERIEVEAVVQVAAHLANVRLVMLTTEGVRARLGMPKGPGAYKALLKAPDAKARANESRRERFVLAKAALKS